MIAALWNRNLNQEETAMNATTIAVDLAKDVFEVACTTSAGRIGEHRRLNRRQFDRFLADLPTGIEVVMEACGTAHYWGRRCQALGLVPRLLPTQYVRAYVRRHKTDRTDAEALLEARRCGGILAVPVKTAEHQAVQSLHRVRTQWQTARTARINVIRGLLREYGIPLGAGAVTIRRAVPALLDDVDSGLPGLLRQLLRQLLEELADLERRLTTLDRELGELAETNPVARRLRTVPGVGVIVATGLLGSVPHIHAFRRGRHFASWLGLTPRESSSGMRHWRGGISKRGDVYLRCQLTHGARSVLVNAQRRARVHAERLTALQRWAIELAARRGHNKAVSALANKLARIIWAVWRADVDFSTDIQSRATA
jgi:transposase